MVLADYTTEVLNAALLLSPPLPCKHQGKSRREKLLLDVADIMHKGLREATQPSCITQHRATRSELLNFVSAEGFTPLHYVCDSHVAGRHAAAAVLALWQERASASTALGGRSSGSGGGGGGDRSALVGDPSGSGGGGDFAGIKADEGFLAPVEGSTDRVKILTWLLSESEVDPRVRVPRGATTLHMAAALPGSEAGPDLVRLLIHNGGVNLDALDSPASSGGGGGDRFWKTSHTKDPPRAGGGGGAEGEMPPLRFSALHYAVQAGSWESADLLLAAGASVAPEGAFPPCLHVACLAAAPVSLVERLLLEDDGRPSGTAAATGDVAGPHGVTPLFLAAAAGSADLVDLLLQPTRGGTTLEDIAENETATMVGAGEEEEEGGGCEGSLARAAGRADDLENIWTMEHSRSDGRSPLHAAADGGHTNVARVLLDAELAAAVEDRTSSSLARLSWLNTQDKWGNTPADLAVSAGHWEFAEVLAAAPPFDIRLAVRGPSGALIAAERANMAIVDDGRGDPSTLCALRESNRLVMTLLRRLRDAVAEEEEEEEEEAEAARAAAATTEEAPGSATDRGGGGDDLAHQLAGDQAAIQDSTATEPPEEGEADQLENEARPPFVASSSAASASPAATAARSTPVPVVHHLHPCFAEGVLYSNAKGIFVPDTPERRRHRRESRQGGRSGQDDHQNRAAVIIQSRARQAGARRAVAEKRRLRRAKYVRRSSVSLRRRSSWSDATDQEKAAVVIQSQARQARARADMARIREQRKQQQQQQQLRRRSSKQITGEVGVVVVKAAG